MSHYLKINLILAFLLSTFLSNAQEFTHVSPSPPGEWPVEVPWWKRNNLRVMQCNLPAYEATLNVEHLIEDLQRFSVNTLIIIGGGIMAFYPTELEFQYTNPYMQPDMLGDVVEKCHALNIRVITRFDFSRFHRSIFEKHPDWAYISPDGDRIINDDLYMAAINGPYVQEKSVAIVQELLSKYPVDGIFINMPGYHTSNAYEGTYHGIDQNTYDQKRFKEYSGGMDLPLQEDINDPVFRKYQEFKRFTADDWMEKIHRAVKAINSQIAICTYQEKYVDIIRHESQTNSLPYWPYMSFDNVTNTMNSQPDHIVSNASIQQISFRSRYNAIEPEETAIRLFENIAAGSGLDMSMMGDFRDYEDERNFGIWEEVYNFHTKNEAYYGKYASPAEICVISSSYWPGGTTAQEYRGIQLMLKESHLQYDIMEYREIENQPDKIRDYKLVIIPQIPELSPNAIRVLQAACQNGTAILATNQTMLRNPDALKSLFGATPVNAENEVHGNYVSPADKSIFTRFEEQTILFWKFNLGLYQFDKDVDKYLSIYTPGRPGPPEKIGGHEPTGYHAVGIKKHGQGKAALMPLNVGRLYYIHGYEQHKNLVLDLIDYIYPQAQDLIKTNAHPRVELVMQNFTYNIAENYQHPNRENGTIIHLVNLTGFSGNTYFEPIPASGIQCTVRLDFAPQEVFSLKQERKIPFEWDGKYLRTTLDKLYQYDALVIEK